MWRGVSIEVAAWDGAGADVDLSCACMFSHELAVAGPAGGLLHLDQALGGALTSLRRSGHFRADVMETLLLDRPPATIHARSVLMIGLGDPQAWTPALTARAAATALRHAVQGRVSSAAFAPSVLDAGIVPDRAADIPAAMMRAVAAALDAQAALVERGLAAPLSLRNWIFDVGAPRFDGAASRFEAELHALSSGKEPA